MWVTRYPVEEEFQIVDPDTWELRSHVSELLAPGATRLGDQIKRELHQSIVEVGTKICRNVNELEEEIHHIRHELTSAAEGRGLAIAAAGTHPFSHWKDQVISPGERYETIVEELQMLARSLLIFGLHVDLDGRRLDRGEPAREHALERRLEGERGDGSLLYWLVSQPQHEAVVVPCRSPTCANASSRPSVKILPMRAA
jgi:hypothetical protein